MSVTVQVPAKVNLHLAVGGTRPDGYHELVSVFQAVSLHDTVTATPAPELSVTLEGEDIGAVPADRRNLAAAAAALLAERIGVDPGVHLHIDKRIPVAGGMAGGSADAAAAIVGCAALWGLDPKDPLLAEVAAEVGSDVAFALMGGTAVGTGRGERLTALPDSGRFHWVFAEARGGLSTPRVFREYDLLLAESDTAAPAPAELAPAPDFAAALASGDPDRLAALLRNDLEGAALRLRPELADTLGAGLDAGALGALVSGSGPTCAFLVRDEAAAGTVAAALEASGHCRSVRTAHGPVDGPAARVTTGTDRSSLNVSQGAAVKSVEVPAEPGGREHPGVPFFTQAATFDALWPSISAHVQDVFDRNKWSHGRKCLEFERAVAAYTGAKHAIAVNNGTDALVILLRAAGVRRGDEVVVPAFTFAATATTVAAIGAVPVFADIDPVTYAMDPLSFEKAITERTRAVMPAHLFTQLADMDAISEIADRHGITVLEDSAEGIGMRWNGKHAGLLGRGGVLSFFPTKTLGAIGDAGMILTDDDEVAETAQILRHHGRMGKTIDHIAGISNLSGASGTNSKMDDIQAAVLMAKLPRLDEDIAARARLAQAYHERLSGLPGILRLPTVVERAVPTDAVFYVYEIEVERRDELVAHLASRGIGTETYYPIPLHVQPCFAHLGYGPGDFPVAEAACASAVALPFYPDLTGEQLDTVVAAIRDFFTGSQS